MSGKKPEDFITNDMSPKSRIGRRRVNFTSEDVPRYNRKKKKKKDVIHVVDRSLIYVSLTIFYK